MNKADWLQSKSVKLNKLYPGLHQIHGPYVADDNRRRVVLKLKSGKRITKQYAKIKLEIRDGIVYDRDETVDHRDRNTLNDRYANLVIRERKAHCRLDVKRRKRISLLCVECGASVLLSRDQMAKREKRKAGPFCSRRCTGIYGARVQNGGHRLKRNPKTTTTKYYHLKK